MSGTADIREGMQVLDADNQLLGMVESVDDDGITINGQEVPLGAVSRVQGGHVHLKGAGSLYMPVGRSDDLVTAGGAVADDLFAINPRREDVRVHHRDQPDRPVQPGDDVLHDERLRVHIVDEEIIGGGVGAASRGGWEERYGQARPDFERSFAGREGIAGGRTFADAEPHYRTGFMAGHDERYAGREFDEIEPDLRRTHESSGSATPFEQLRNDIHEGFIGARRPTTAGASTMGSSAHAPTTPSTMGASADAATTASTGERVGEELVIPLVEERLGVERRATELGEVEVRRAVVEQSVEVPVDVMREEVHVERRDIADRPITAADAERLFEAGAIRVPVHGEQVIVGKEAVVTGEVVINKEQLVERQEITDTLRKQEVTVDENYAKHLPAFERHFAQRQEVYRAPRTFAQAEPNYRAGFEAGSDERYAGRDFEHIEPELRRTYEGTATTTVADESGWEHLREEVREGFDRARGR